VPVAVAITIALVDPLSAALAKGSAAQPLGFQRHQAFGSEADHVAQHAGIGGLLQQRLKGGVAQGFASAAGGMATEGILSLAIVVVLGSELRFAPQPLPSAAAVATAVDKSPA